MKKNSLTGKIITVFIFTALLSALLCACGKEASYDAASTVSSGYSSMKSESYGEYAMADSPAAAPSANYAYDSSTVTDDEAMTESGSIVTSGAAKETSLSEKIIYSAYAYVETTDFDTSIENVYKMVEMYNGFLESSSVGGTNYSTSYYGNQTYRHAYFTIRVPSEHFADVRGAMDTLGYVTSVDTYTDNITTRYYDTQSRLDAYKAESERLIEMLGKADTVEEMIYIESRLSDVQYSIDSLTSTLKNWQNSVDYSTIELNISEVAVIRVTPAVKETYWQKMSKGFKDTLVGIGEFFKDIFMWIVVSLPVLLILAVIAVAIIIIIKNSIKKHRAKTSVNYVPQTAPNNYQLQRQEVTRQ